MTSPIWIASPFPKYLSPILLMLSRAKSPACALDPIPTWLLSSERRWSNLVTTNQGPEKVVVEPGVVPSDCKQAFTTHLLKKTSLSGEDVTNFHPDFMLWFLSKTHENTFFFIHKIGFPSLLYQKPQDGTVTTLPSICHALHVLGLALLVKQACTGMPQLFFCI